VLKAERVAFNPNSIEVEAGSEIFKERKKTTPVTQNTTIPDSYKKASRKTDEKEFINSKKEDAELIILKARNDAQMIVDNAKQEAERAQSQAYNKGFEKGYAEGHDASEEEARQLKLKAEALLKEARHEREQALAGLERQSVSLITDILDKLIGEAARVNPQIIMHLVKTGLRNIPSNASVRIRVSPADADIVGENIDKLGLSTRPEVVTDSLMRAGDCVIETSSGNIQSGLGGQWQLMKADLAYLMGGADTAENDNASPKET
jgi:flagellar assembly protein FliH